jgi:hypothetical protein
MLRPDAASRQRFDQLVQLSGVDRIVRLGETSAVSVPIVAGWLKPVILLPLGVVASLPAEQVEAILLHELAHISRYDYLVNLLQNIVETIFFYHPAVWSVSRRIRLERELACDDQTVQWCKNPRTYAEALAGFEEFRHQSPLLAATGEGDLFTRIRRILVGPQPERRGVPIFAVAGFCGIGIYLASMFLAPLLAATIVTDQERVAQIQALQPPTAPDDHVGPGSSINIRGTIKTEDGLPLPKSLIDQVHSMKRSEAMVTSSYLGGAMSGGLDFEDSRNQEFYCWASQPGTVQIGIWAEGYAPLRKQVAPAEDGEGKPALRDRRFDLILKRGFPARVQILGSDGQLLRDVVITARFPRPGDPLQLSMPPTQTNADGFTTFGNVESNSEIHLIAFKPGWQMADQVVSQWAQDTPLVWKLEPAMLTSGVVIDQVTKKPIAGADIVLAARKAPGEANFQVFGPEDGQVLGHSDAKGHFELENLTANYSSRIYVRISSYPVAVFPITYGDQNRICEVPPGLHIGGKILDPNGVLSSNHPLSPFELQCFYTINAAPNYGIGRNKQHALSKFGPVIPFSFDNIPKGPVALGLFSNGLVDYRQDFDLEKSGDDYVIDLGANASADLREKPDPRPLRTVEITLTPWNLTGSIDGSYLTVAKTESWYLPKTLPIANGKATGQIPVPTTLGLGADHLVGYWFPPGKIDVPLGTGPFTYSITALAAGVIHGHVTLTGPLKNQNITLVPLALKTPPTVKPLDLSGITNATLSPSNDYVTPPLPCGGTYAMLLIASSSYLVTPPVTLDAEHPIVSQDIQATVGHDTLYGKFVDESNRPISNQEVTLTYHPTEYSGFGNYAATTGSDGTFTISEINLHVPGNYELQLSSNSWIQNKVRIDNKTTLPLTIVASSKNSSR